MRRKSLLLSSLVCMVMLLAACNSESTVKQIEKPWATFSNFYNTPAHTGGAIVIGDWRFPDSLNPLLARSQVSQDIIPGIWNSCAVQLPDLQLDEKGFKPDQCSEIPTLANGDESSDGLTTILKFDPNMVWSDGQPITAADYGFFLDMALGPALHGSAPFDAISRYHIIAPHTLAITWRAPYGPYLAVVARLAPLPSHAYASQNIYSRAGKFDPAAASRLLSAATFQSTFPVVNGAFQIARYSADNSITLTPNPHFYSNFFHASVVDQVIFKKAVDKQTLIADFQAGTYDKVAGFGLADLASFGKIDQRDIVEMPQIAIDQVTFNQRAAAPIALGNGGVSPFSDKLVRQAFAQGAFLCNVLRRAYDADCHDPNVFTGELSGPYAHDFDPTVSNSVYDATAAANLLTAAGYPLVNGQRMLRDGATPFAITFVSPGGDAAQYTLVNLLAQQWHDNLGVAVTTQTADPALLTAPYDRGGILATGAYDVAFFPQYFGSDPQIALDQRVRATQIPSAQSPDGINYAGVSDPELEAQITAARGTLDQLQRERALAQAQKYLAAQYDFYPIATIPTIALLNPNLENYHLSPFAGDDWNMGEWWSDQPRPVTGG